VAMNLCRNEIQFNLLKFLKVIYYTKDALIYATFLTSCSQ